jgi:hypothetical protein
MPASQRPGQARWRRRGDWPCSPNRAMSARFPVGPSHARASDMLARAIGWTILLVSGGMLVFVSVANA